MDLQAFFKREAAQYRLVDLKAAYLAKQARIRSERTAKGNRTKAARRAGA